MDVLSYSPKVEAYVQGIRNGELVYYDLTDDIVKVNVSRNSGQESSFDLVLQNKGWKYNDAFMPMDKIAIYATKTDRFKLFSGYITSVDRFTLYQSDFKMSGKCPIYLLKRLYWDPHLVESVRLLSTQGSSNPSWGGYAETIMLLLTEVGNWNDQMVAIGDVPVDVLDWAYRIYVSKRDDISQLKDLSNAFFGVLQSHGPKAAANIDVGAVGVGGGNSAAKAAKPNGGLHADGAEYHQVQGNNANCGATSFTVALNIMLGLKGGNAYGNVAVWNSSAFGCDSTWNLAGKGTQFLINEGLSGKLSFYEASVGTVDRMREELQQGHIVCISSGSSAKFLRTDGSFNYYPDGHFIAFYNYSNGTFFANDSSSSIGNGVPYSEADLQQWFDGRPGHHNVGVMAVKG